MLSNLNCNIVIYADVFVRSLSEETLLQIVNSRATFQNFKFVFTAEELNYTFNTFGVFLKKMFLIKTPQCFKLEKHFKVEHFNKLLNVVGKLSIHQTDMRAYPLGGI